MNDHDRHHRDAGLPDSACGCASLETNNSAKADARRSFHGVARFGAVVVFGWRLAPASLTWAAALLIVAIAVAIVILAIRCRNPDAMALWLIEIARSIVGLPTPPKGE
jgi:hypothetical protein